MAQPSDHAAVIAHIHKSYIPDEPLGKHLGREKAMSSDFNANVQPALDGNLTFITIDKLRNVIAGVRLISIRRKNENIEPPPNTHRKSLAIRSILTKISERANIFERYSEIDHYADFVLISVDRDYRGCGLVSEIYERAYRMLKAMNVPLIKCIFTNPYTEKIELKTGFHEVARVNLRDWKYDDDGEPCAPNAANEDCAVESSQDEIHKTKTKRSKAVLKRALLVLTPIEMWFGPFMPIKFEFLLAYVENLVDRVTDFVVMFDM